MKLLLLFFIISVNLSSKSNHHFPPRKMQENKGPTYFNPDNSFSLKPSSISSSELEDKLILVGFGNFQKETGKIDFNIYFKKCGSVTNNTYNSLKFNVSLNEKIKSEEIECELNDTLWEFWGEYTDVSYYCSKKVNYTGEIEIESLNNFQFYNETNNLTSYDNLNLSSLANKTYNKISKQTADLEYITFYVDKKISKDNEYTLKGNMSQNTTLSWAYLNLNNTNVGCSVTNNTIKFNLINTINEHLYSQIASPIAIDERKILILTKKNINDSINYKAGDLLVELIGFGNFKHENNKNATSQAYIRGSSDYLNITNYINFTVFIRYNTKSLRRLQEGTEKVVVFGEIDKEKREKGINIYNMTLLNTTNKTINYAFPISRIKYLDSNKVQIMSQLPFNVLEDNGINEGDDDFDDYKYFKYIENLTENFNVSKLSESFGLLNNETQNYEIIQKIGEVNTKYAKFEFDFNVEGELDIKKNGTTAYLNYPKNQSESLYIRDEISCSIFKIPSSYRLSCKPPKNIYTDKKYIRITVPVKKPKLRFLADTYMNRTLLSPNDANGTLDIDVFPDYIYKTNSRGLSAGAIVAIVLSCVAVIAAILASIFFFSRGTNAPVKNIKDVNVDNSTYKVNN